MAATALAVMGGGGVPVYWPALSTPASTGGPCGSGCQVLRPPAPGTNTSPQSTRNLIPEAACHIMASLRGASSNGKVSASAPGDTLWTFALAKKRSVWIG